MRIYGLDNGPKNADVPHHGSDGGKVFANALAMEISREPLSRQASDIAPDAGGKGVQVAIAPPAMPVNQLEKLLQGGVHTLTGQVRSKIGQNIEKLRHNGDSSTFEIGGEFKAHWFKGFKTQYRNEVIVTQVGGSQVDGTPASEAPVYEVKFDKRLMLALTLHGGVEVVTAGGEAGIRTTDSVVMRFASKADAIRGVRILGDLAASEFLRDIGRTVAGKVFGLLSNPVLDGRDSSLTATRFLGDLLLPSADELAFIRDHVSGYSTRLTARGRVSIDKELGLLGLRGRLDLEASIERQVVYPRGEQPGYVTYTVPLEWYDTSKQRLMLNNLSPVNIHNRTEHGSVGMSVSLVYIMNPDGDMPSLNGRILPELQDLPDSQRQRGPDAVEVRMNLNSQNTLGSSGSHPDQTRTSVIMRSVRPLQEMPTAMAALMIGDYDLVASMLTEGGGGLEMKTERVRRDGFEIQPELKLGLNNASVRASIILQASSDSVVKQQVKRYGILDNRYFSTKPERVVPEMEANKGDPAIAARNIQSQLEHGSSPYDLVDARGLNHGNPVIDLVNRIYFVTRQHQVLGQSERIKNNAHAGQLLGNVLDNLEHDPKARKAVLERMANAYGISFNNKELDAYNRQKYKNSAPPGNSNYVRQIFQGGYRWEADVTTGQFPTYGVGEGPGSW